jgi:hypothetical protein
MMYRPENMDGYSTHLPVLARLIGRMEAPRLLEFGSGYYSTPLIQSHAGESIENDPVWLAEIQKYYPRVFNGEPRGEYYDLIFVDCSPEASRRERVKENIHRCDLFVLHDALPAWEEAFQYETLKPLFKYSYLYDALCPYTLVLSQHEITAFTT